MSVREATEDDLIDLVDLAYDFYLEDPFYRCYVFDAEFVAQRFAVNINRPDRRAFVFDGEKGVQGAVFGVLGDHMFNRSKVVHEDGFFVSKTARTRGVGVKLLAELEKWAKSEGADIYAQIKSQVAVSGAAEFLNKQGYETHGLTFIKRID